MGGWLEQGQDLALSAARYSHAEKMRQCEQALGHIVTAVTAVGKLENWRAVSTTACHDTFCSWYGVG